VRYAFHIFQGDAAGADGHREASISFSLFVRHRFARHGNLRRTLDADKLQS
jgi:hypothetical protein